MDRLELQRLRDLPIERVAERLGLQVTRHKCLCPFHEDHHPSMSFSIRKNTYRCFVCGEHGGTIDLVMKYLRKDFREAVEWLGGAEIISTFNSTLSTDSKLSTLNSKLFFDASRYEKFFERPWLSPEARRFLFEERKLDPRVVRWCRLTSWKDRQGVPWLQIPYYDMDGKLIGVQNRRLGMKGERKKGDGLIPTTPQTNLHPSSINLHPEPRFRFPAGSKCGIYNLPVLKMLKPGEELWITEGCSDCWAMLSSGHKAIAIPSATLLSKEDKDVLSGVKGPLGLSACTKGLYARLQEMSNVKGQMSNVKGSIKFHMFPDADVPGERLFLQLKEVLPNLVRHQLPEGCKDYSDFFVKRTPSPP